MRSFFLVSLFLATSLTAAEPAYQSPYKVNFNFKEDELIGDLLKGPRADWKDQSAIKERDWYNEETKRRWGYWGPPAKHYNPPAGFAGKSADWMRERIIATGLRFAGYGYQHHHIPDWEPPADWPKAEKIEKTGKGLDCSNFTAFVYNLALGIKPTGDVQDQSVMTKVDGPGANRSIPVQRIESPGSAADWERVLKTGDLLFVKNRSGNVSHVVLWVGKIGQERDGTPLVLDSTGEGSRDEKGQPIPNGVNLRPFNPNSWYANSASHALRIIPDGK